MPILSKNRCTILAEIGSNHDGSLERAKKLIVLAKESGADAVKFQSFQAETLCFHAHPAFAVVRENQLPLQWLAPLMKYAEENRIAFLSTPFDLESLQQLASLQVPAIKIASGDLTYHELLQEAAKTAIPIFLSTGHAALDEVKEALAALEKGGCKQVVLLHCTSLYPALPKDVNLRAMQTLASTFNVPVGFSDHTLDEVAMLGACALGAVVLEKHFTDDKTRHGPDHSHSMEPEEFFGMVKKIRQLEQSLGNGEKVPRPAEEQERIWARRALYSAKKIPEGKILERDDLKVVRPANPDGIGAASLFGVIGKKAKITMQEDELIRWTDISS